MKVKFWGVRGSIASPGEETARYGGNTTCVELRFSNELLLVIDAGTGIRKLGKALLSEGHKEINILFTHSHWDHIQGFPFFAPAYDKGKIVNIIGFPETYSKLQEVLQNQMESKFFPVDFGDLNAQINFKDFSTRLLGYELINIQAIKNNHPGETYGYKITENNKNLVFITDNELVGSPKEITNYNKFVDFCKNADCLIHDAMYTNDELRERQGYGHTSYSQAIKLAIDANVKKVLLFHHDPDHNDSFIDEMVEECRDIIKKSAPYPLECHAASEGLEILI